MLPFLTARGLQTDGWSEEVRDVLRTPQHLLMFLEHLTGRQIIPGFTTYQGLLDRIIRERLQNTFGFGTVEAAESIAIEMAKEEELWLARGRFERKFGAELTNLEAAGFLVLSEDKLRIAFRHQTLFDFLRARAFVRDSQSLAEYVLSEKQASLFVRPVLWSALHYLRASDKAGLSPGVQALVDTRRTAAASTLPSHYIFGPSRRSRTTRRLIGCFP